MICIWRQKSCLLLRSEQSRETIHVVEPGGEPEAYAERLYAESPVASVSGVAGADLKKRIPNIISGRAGIKLSLGRRLILTATLMVGVTVPLVFGLEGVNNYL